MFEDFLCRLLASGALSVAIICALYLTRGTRNRLLASVATYAVSLGGLYLIDEDLMLGATPAIAVIVVYFVFFFIGTGRGRGEVSSS